MIKTFTISMAFTVAFTFLIPTQTEAANRRVIIQDEATFYSYVAQQSNNPGTPVGPKPKVQICHKGRTITVSLAAVPGHLGHGDSIGPCPPKGATSWGLMKLRASNQ
jgi:hypothetical protein